MIGTEMTNETWPHCIGENVHALAKPVNWTAACARAQMRSGASLGTAGEALRVALLPVGSVNVDGDLGMSGE